MPVIAFYDARPVSLIYYSHEFHVMDLKVQVNILLKMFEVYINFLKPFLCSCNELTFGSVNDILAVYSDQDIPKPGAEVISTTMSEFDVKKPRVLAEGTGKIKVINYFLQLFVIFFDVIKSFLIPPSFFMNPGD